MPWWSDLAMIMVGAKSLMEYRETSPKSDLQGATVLNVEGKRGLAIENALANLLQAMKERRWTKRCSSPWIVAFHAQAVCG